MSDAFKGAFIGILLGATGGLGVCLWILDDPMFFLGNTMLIGAGLVLVLYPDSNLRTAKIRPALVIQADHCGTC